MEWEECESGNISAEVKDLERYWICPVGDRWELERVSISAAGGHTVFFGSYADEDDAKVAADKIEAGTKPRDSQNVNDVSIL